MCVCVYVCACVSCVVCVLIFLYTDLPLVIIFFTLFPPGLLDLSVNSTAIMIMYVHVFLSILLVEVAVPNQPQICPSSYTAYTCTHLNVLIILVCLFFQIFPLLSPSLSCPPPHKTVPHCVLDCDVLIHHDPFCFIFYHFIILHNMLIIAPFHHLA